MEIHFYIEGLIKNNYKRDAGVFELDDGSTLEQFFVKFNETERKESQFSLWDIQKKRFRGPVSITVDGQKIKSQNYILTNKQTVKLAYYIVGG